MLTRALLRASVLTAGAVAAAAAAPSCAETADEAGLLQVAGQRLSAAADAGEVERLVMLSDTHMVGPEYKLGGENGIIDNDSITKTQQRMYAAIKSLNGLLNVEPTPKLAIFGGDIVHNGLHILEHHDEGFTIDAAGVEKLFNMSVNGYSIAAKILSDLRIPQLLAWGNHDNLMSCGQPEASLDKDLAASVYQHYFGAKPYDARDLGTWRILGLNCMYGTTWDPSSDRCWDRLASFGEEQLRWLDGQLQDGKPTVIFMHWPPVTSAYNETGTEQYKDLKTVLGRHDNVKLLLSGHFHKGMNWEGINGGIPSITVPGVRYNAQNFFILDLYKNGSCKMADWAKNRNLSRCSDWWEYNNSFPDGVFHAPYYGKDPGSCGDPSSDLDAEEAAASSLADINIVSEEDVPSQDDFNPEGACRFEFAKHYFGGCEKGDLEACCGVIGEEFRPSSSAPFSSCLCKPSFWKATQAHLAQLKLNASEVMDECINKYEQKVLYVGGPMSWCA